MKLAERWSVRFHSPKLESQMETGFEDCGRSTGFSPLEHFLCCHHNTFLTPNDNWVKSKITL